MRTGVLIGFVILAVAAMLPTSAWAIAIAPDAIYIVSLFANNPDNPNDPNARYFQPGSYASTYCWTGTQCADGTAVATETLSVFASGTSSASSGIYGSSANINYYYQVNGPDNIAVPLNIVGHLAVVGPPLSHRPDFSNGFARASIRWGIGWSANAGPRDDIHEFVACDGDASGCFGYPIRHSVDIDENYSLTANTPAAVAILAMGNLSFVIGGYTAFADPVITIDPTFAAAHPEYSLQFSPNISAVPEPAGSLLMVVGIAGLAGVWRTRSRLTRASASIVQSATVSCAA